MNKDTAYEQFEVTFWQAVASTHRTLCYWEILKEMQRFVLDLMIKSEAEYKVKGGQ